MPLTIINEERKLINEETFDVITVPKTIFKMEHSLLSISKWESIWHDAFIKDRETFDEDWTEAMTISYYQCMTINGPFPPINYVALTPDNEAEIEKYIKDPMTGTTFSNNETKGPPIGNITTSEEIYYMMFKWGIPKDCEKWHINRLLTLIRVFGEKENPKKKSRKQSLQEMYNRNEMRKAKAAKRRKR